MRNAPDMNVEWSSFELKGPFAKDNGYVQFCLQAVRIASIPPRHPAPFVCERRAPIAC